MIVYKNQKYLLMKSIFLSAFMIFVITSCGNRSNDNTSTTDSSNINRMGTDTGTINSGGTDTMHRGMDTSRAGTGKATGAESRTGTGIGTGASSDTTRSGTGT